jgi:tetratricopeptide (TPR) repeat protein
LDGSEATEAFLRHLARAEAKSADCAWPEAASLWELVVAANPVEGHFWTQLAGARYHIDDYRGAITAYEHALALRDGYPAETAYRLACCYARLQDSAAALSWLERALDMGYRDLAHAQADDDLALLREDERFRELVGLIDTSHLSRDDGWRADLRFLAREVKRRAYAPFQHVSEERFDVVIQEITRQIPQLTDEQIIVELTKLLRLLGDGHAGVYPAKTHQAFKQRLPIQFFLFAEGLFIVATDPGHEGLLGAQILRFGEHPVEEVMTAVDTLLYRDNDNEQWSKQIMPRRLRELHFLHALGLTPDPDTIALTIRDATDEVQTTTLMADPDSPASERANSFPSSPEGWTFFPATLSTPLPRYLQNVGTPYWFEYVPDERIIYVQFNAVQDHPTESLADFSERLFGFIDDHEVAKLVIDVRWNGGGNTFLELPLIRRIIGSRLHARGRLFVIIGRGTFSAAQNFSGMLNKFTEAIFVGEPTGSSPTFIGETVEFELPFSKSCVNVSDLLWQGTWPMDYRIWIAPTLYTPPTFAAFGANRDPAFEAVLACREHLPGW